MKYLKHISKVVLSFFLAGVISLPTYALTDDQWSFFNANKIYYWNPEGGNCIDSDNLSYSSSSIYTNSEINAITKNQAIYEEAVQPYGFNWQILAVLHSKENNSTLTNPDTLNGVYHIPNSPEEFPAGEIDTDEFLRQSKIIAEIINKKAEEENLNLKSDNGIKRLFYLYNGESPEYNEKAEKLGYKPENGDGSPYVMNRYDAKRDPNNPEMSPIWPGMYQNGHYVESATTTEYGTYVLYIGLGGNGVASRAYCVGGQNLVAGGMTLAEAQALMEEYKKIDIAPYNLNFNLKENCVGFVQYFINRYTIYNKKLPIGIGGLPNGRRVVSVLLNEREGFTNNGHTPRAYAIFSTPRGSSNCTDNEGQLCGHTGVVLGVDVERGKVVIGQAAYGSGSDAIEAVERDISIFSSNDYTYAGTDGILLLSGD